MGQKMQSKENEQLGQRCGVGYTRGIYGHDDHTSMAGDWEETE